MPSGTPAAKQMVEVGRPGEYTIAIGETLKRSHDADGDVFTSVKYNRKPAAALSNVVPPRLTKHAASGEAPYTLTLTPPATSANSTPVPVTYTGSQHVPPPRKTECILLFNPTTQSFTLEKLSSTFTFNAKVYALAHPPLPLRPPIPDGEDDDASAGEKEDDNPWDYRHFINKKSTTKTRAEQKAEREERRKEALKRAGKGAPEDDEPEEEDEEDLGLGISYGRATISGKGLLASAAIGPRKVGGKSPFGGKKPTGMSPGVPLPSPAHGHRGGDSSSDEDGTDEADDEDDDEEDGPTSPPPRLAPPAKKPPVPRNTAAARRKAQQEEPEEIVFPEPSQPLHVEDPSEEEISDVDESDEEPPHRPAPAPAPAPIQQEEEEEEDDGMDLAELLEKELESGDGEDIDIDAEGEPDGDGEIIFEDEDMAPTRGPPKNVGLGIGVGGGAPMSLGALMGGGVEDESESESEEE